MRPVRLVVVWLLAAGVAGAAGPSAETGRALFSGARPCQAGGAPCHALGGEGLAFTASLGPELSSSLATMEPDALDGLLEALPFPTMAPIYDGRPLTPSERADLAAFLIPAARQGPPRGAWHLEAWGLGVASFLLAGLALAWRGRKPPSRARLLARAARLQGGSR
jgi:hypothetical protein